MKNTFTLTRSNIRFDIDTTPDQHGTLRVIATNGTDTQAGTINRRTTGEYQSTVEFSNCQNNFSPLPPANWLLDAADRRSWHTDDHEDDDMVRARGYDACTFALTVDEVAAITAAVSEQSGDRAESPVQAASADVAVAHDAPMFSSDVNFANNVENATDDMLEHYDRINSYPQKLSDGATYLDPHTQTWDD